MLIGQEKKANLVGLIKKRPLRQKAQLAGMLNYLGETYRRQEIQLQSLLESNMKKKAVQSGVMKEVSTPALFLCLA